MARKKAKQSQVEGVSPTAELLPASPPAPTPKSAQHGTKTLSIRNRGDRSVVFNLPCKEYCVTECACEVHERVIEEYNARTQEHVQKLVKRLICQSLTFLGGETKRDLPEGVLKVSSIAAAVKRGELVVTNPK